MPGWMLRFVGGGILVAIDGGDGWLLHTPVPAGEDPATWDPEDAMFTAIGEPFDYEVIDRSRWTARAMVATKWRDGNVFLAGDAAHVWVPMGGFGMNAGIADAASLSWRLAAAVEGWGSEGLIESYAVERVPIGGSIAEQAVTWAIDTAIAIAPEPGRAEALEADTADGQAARAALDEQIRRDLHSEFESPGFQLGIVYRDSPVVGRRRPHRRPHLPGRRLRAHHLAGLPAAARRPARRDAGLRRARSGLHAPAGR